MKKFLIVLLFALASCALAKAQDIVVLRDGTQIAAKVLQVGTYEIKYVKTDNPNGPTYVLAVNELARIVYQNGTVDEFAPEYRAYVRPDPIDYRVKYSTIKHSYNPRMYTEMQGDPYEPWACALGSLFLPGMGQMIAGETGRGLAIMGANAGFFMLEVAELVHTDGFSYVYSNSTNLFDNGGALFLTVLGQLAFNIWCIFDAARIAKVKNMYFQDMEGLLGGVQVKFQPELAMMPAGNGCLAPGAGFTLSFTF